MRRIDTPDGLYHDGDPGAGVAGTIVKAASLNAVQEEIISVLTGAGIGLDPGSDRQLLDALIALGLRAASTAKAGVVKLADAATILAGADSSMAATAASLLVGLLGAGGTTGTDYMTFPFRDKTSGARRNAILQFGSVAPTVTANSNNSITFPITYPNACLATIGVNGDASAQPNALVATVGVGNQTSFNWRSNVGGTTRINWISVGY